MKLITIPALAGAVLCVLMTLLYRPASAEQMKILDEPDLRIEVTSAEVTEEAAEIHLACENLGDREAQLLFLVPKTDGIDTVFGNGWPSEKVMLPPGEILPVDLTIYPAEDDESIQEVSFRMSFQDQLSTEGKLLFGEDLKCEPAGFSGREEQMVRDEILMAPDTAIQQILIRDQITEEELRKLDYGQAWICLREGETLIPFCSILLNADETGKTEATYSGLALLFEGEKQPLEVRERYEHGTVTLTGKEISLTGESVFFATLQLTVRGSQKEPFRVIRQVLNSSELGGAYDGAPLLLADQAEPLLRVLEKNEAPVDTIDTRSVFLSLDEPLSLRLTPAADLGEIWIYCEYFFTDQTDVVHAPWPMQ